MLTGNANDTDIPVIDKQGNFVENISSVVITELSWEL